MAIEREHAATVARAERAEAAAAQIRAVLQTALVGGVLSAETCKRLLATDVGVGYLSPEQHVRAVAEARRQALEEAAAHLEEIGRVHRAKAVRALVKP